ncbi:MAG: hypothetical protein R3F49_12135 [Planctomycetota bacterium]
MFTTFREPRAFLAATQALAAADEAHFGMPLGLIADLTARVADGRAALVERDLFLGVLALASEPRALVVKTIADRALIAEGPAPASDAAWRDAAVALAAHAPRLPRVFGTRALLARFEPLWRAATQARVRATSAMRLHRLDQLREPGACSGRMRRATEADLELVRHWMWRFAIDVRDAPETSSPPTHVPQLAEGRVFLWEDPEPVCMTAWARPLAHSASINSVYTPPEQRGKGYAAALVAAVSRGLLEGDPAVTKHGTGTLAPRRFLCLYTDMHNPTANRLYARLGYTALSDWDALHFEYPASPPRDDAR